MAKIYDCHTHILAGKCDSPAEFQRKTKEAGFDGGSVFSFGEDPSECTVDGCHATDLGFYFISKRMAPVIEQILSTDS